MRLADRAREPVRRSQREHEMDVVGHQAIGPHLDRLLAAALGEHVAVKRVVGRLEDDLAAYVVIVLIGTEIARRRTL